MAIDSESFLDACAKGGAALEKFVRHLHNEHSGRLLREARAAIGSVETAHDLVQSTFEKAWRQCKQFRGESGVLAWMLGILRHAILDHLRATRPERNQQDWLDENGYVLAEVERALRVASTQSNLNPEEWALQNERHRVYLDCSARFASEHPAAALVLRWSAENDMTIDELANLLGRTPAATREYLSQCRKKARVFFAPWYRLLLP